MRKDLKNRAGQVSLIAASIILILLSCVSGIWAMSIDEETKLGKEFLLSVNKELTIIDDPFVNEYLSDLGNYIGQFQDTKPFDLDFYVAKNSELNAFAGPAGHLFFYSGIINAMDEVDELASVISHEIGHVTARHLAGQQDKYSKVAFGTLAGMLAGVLIGGDAGEALMVGSSAAAQQAMLSYSRDDEREADQLGFKKAYLAGFKPDAFIKALARLQQSQWGSEQIPAYLSTHPVDSERMSNLEIISRQYSGSNNTEKAEYFRRLYPLFRTIIKAQSIDPKDAERYFSSELEKSPDSSLAQFGLGIALQKRGDYDNAIAHYSAALEGMTEKASVLRYMGEAYHQKGQTPDAIKTFEKALAINSKDKYTLYLLASTYQEAEDYAKAENIYDRLTLMDPVKDDVFYNLGLCLGRENKLASAHYNFGVYFKRMGDRDNADFHFKKAGELAGADQALQDKIKKEMEEMKKDDKGKKQQQPPGSGS